MLFRNVAFTALIASASTSAFAEGHAAIDQMRSYYNKNIFILTGVEGETGSIEKSYKGSTDQDKETFRGFGIRNGVGVEAFKFVEFSLAHTFVNLKGADQSLETLTGSRLSGEVALNFSAPLTNIQFGLGVTGSQLTYTDALKSSSFTGAGHYYSIGLNYFVSQSISLQMTGKRTEGVNSITGGSSDVRKMESNIDSLGLGIAIWL